MEFENLTLDNLGKLLLFYWFIIPGGILCTGAVMNAVIAMYRCIKDIYK